MTADDAVIYARHLAAGYRAEGFEYAAIGNDFGAELRRASAVVLEAFAFKLDRKIAESRVAA